MVRKVITWTTGTVAIVVVLVFLPLVVTPAVQEWFAPETMSYDLLYSSWGDEGDAFNKLLEEGWRVTGIRYDSCLNIYVDLER